MNKEKKEMMLQKIDEAVKTSKAKGDLLKWFKKLKNYVENEDELGIYMHYNGLIN